MAHENEYLQLKAVRGSDGWRARGEVDSRSKRVEVALGLSILGSRLRFGLI